MTKKGVYINRTKAPPQGVSLQQFCRGDVYRNYAEHWRKLSFDIHEIEGASVSAISLSDRLGIKNHIYRIAIGNALRLRFMHDPLLVFGDLLHLAKMLGDDYIEDMVNCHVARVTTSVSECLSDIFYLAYFEHILNRVNITLGDTKLVLPSKEGRQIVLALVEDMAVTMNPKGHVDYLPSLDGAYHGVVTNGTVSFFAGETLWLFRLYSRGSANICGSDHIPLVVAFVMMKYADKYKDKTIRYLSYMSPMDGRYSQIETAKIPALLLKAVHDELYMPNTDPVSIPTSPDTFALRPPVPGFAIGEWERIKLISAFALTANIGESRHRVRQELLNICCSHIEQPRVKTLCREIFACYVLPPNPFDPSCKYCRQRVILLNQLYYTLNNLNLSRIPQVTLSDDEITLIINKASDLYY